MSPPPPQDLWKKRAPPRPLSLDEVLPDTAEAVRAAASGTSASRSLGLVNPNQVGEMNGARQPATRWVR